MKKLFLFFIFASFAFASCKKTTDIYETNIHNASRILSLDEKKAHLKQLIQSNPQAVLRDAGAAEICNCKYIIYDIEYEDEPEEYEWELWGAEDCPGTSICNYFSTYWSNYYDDCYTNLGCTNDLPSMNTLYNFNCQIPSFYDFNVAFATVGVNSSNCTATDDPECTITFAIVCAPVNPGGSSSCGGSAQSVSTGQLVINYDPNNPSSALKEIQLGGICGCEPSAD